MCKLRQLSLERVKICSKSDWSRFETNINHFASLEQLQIGNLEVENHDANKLINLRNITTISVQYFCGQKFKLKAAKLRKVYWSDDFDELDLTYPANITHLRLCAIDTSKQFSKLKNRFKGISHLYIENLDFFEDFSVFSNFPKLKEVYYSEIEKDALVNLIKQKKISRNLDLKLYFNFFRIEDLNDIDEMFTDFEEDENLLKPVETRIILANYDKLASAVDFSKMDYSALLDCFGSVPPNFNKKFHNLQKVVVGQLIDSQNNFIAFLRKCRLLTKLKINDTRLDQAFYNELNIFCPILSRLMIVLNSTDLIKAFNPSFITSLKFLVKFSYNQSLDSELVVVAFQELKFLETLCFAFNGKKVVLKFDYSPFNLQVMAMDENDEEDDPYKNKMDCLAVLKHVFGRSH